MGESLAEHASLLSVNQVSRLCMGTCVSVLGLLCFVQFNSEFLVFSVEGLDFLIKPFRVVSFSLPL